MARLWISLPAAWKLQDVQAGAAVVISVLSVLASFTYIRLCWQRAVSQVVRGKSIPLHSLLTINVPGEAFDVVLLLKQKLFSSRYINICVQCLLIIVFWALGIFSGPIGRYSTRNEIILDPQQVPGFLGTRFAAGIASDTVGWTEIMNKLNSASFPRNQLPDYLPATSFDWSFESTQWNNSWPLDCRLTPETPIKLEVNGTCTERQSEILGFEQAVDLSRWEFNRTHDVFSYFHNLYDLYKIKDLFYLKHGAQPRWYPNKTGIYPGMNILVLAAYLQGVPTIEANGTGCRFGQGPVDHSSYVKVECDMIVSNETWNSGYGVGPDRTIVENVTNAYKSYYEGRFYKESVADLPITKLEPEELIRFYQAFEADLSTLEHVSVVRTINVKVLVSQLSVIFLSVALLIAILIVVGLVYHGMFAVRHKQVVSGVPLSKVDWMIQSIEAKDRPSIDAQGRSRWSVTVDMPTSWKAQNLSKRRTKEFQAAIYSDRATSTTLLLKSVASTSSIRRLVSNDPAGHMQQGTDEEMDRDDQTSTLNESIVTDAVHLGHIKR